MFPCDECTEEFTRKCNLIRHRNEVHFKVVQKHYVQRHDDVIETLSENNITRIKLRGNNQVRSIRFISEFDLLPLEFFEQAKSLILHTLDTLKQEHQPLKLQCSISVIFAKDNTTDESYFSVRAQPIVIFNLDDMIESLLYQMDQYIQRGSHWKLVKVNFFQINVTMYRLIIK